MTTGCSTCETVSHEGTKQKDKTRNLVNIAVPTMHCSGCMQKVEKQLSDIEGVKSARVNLSLKRVTVSYDNDDHMVDLLLDRLANIGFEAHVLDEKTLTDSNDNTGQSLLIRVGIGAFAAMNVMLLSVSVWAGADDETRQLLHWVSALIALPVITYIGQPFFKNAWSALRTGNLNMDVPISLAIIMACGLSLFETIMGGRHAYFDAALSLTFFLLVGRYLDFQTRKKARSAAVALSALTVSKVQHILDGQVETINIEQLSVGDHILVRQGARVPVDGVITKGVAELDVSLLTGESLPQTVNLGEEVYTGTLNLSSPFEVKVSHLGEGTKLAEIRDLVAQAESTKTRYTTLADRAARIYAPTVHIMALAAFVFWQLYTGDTRLAIGIATAVLIITCPCALGLAVPAVMTTVSGKLFRQGVLIRNGNAIERLVDIDTVVFDKTGTLTTGELTLLNNPSPNDVVFAASLSAYSDHPISKAITKYADELELLPLEDVIEEAGKGISAKYQGKEIKLGNAKWVGAANSNEAAEVWLQMGDAPAVLFQFADQLKPSSKEAIQRLKDRGLKVVMLSGDRQSITDAFAKKLGITHAIGEVLPAQKVDVVRSFGDHVLMIGDGLNDTAALAAAHVSISPAKAIDAARAASDFVLIKDDLGLIDVIISLSKSAKRRMLENFGIAITYNVIAVPIALFGFATPLIAALAMSASSISVSLNALRLPKGKS